MFPSVMVYKADPAKITCKFHTRQLSPVRSYATNYLQYNINKQVFIWLMLLHSDLTYP
jgi:hypothetical protein